jgi:TPR repeat protein
MAGLRLIGALALALTLLSAISTAHAERRVALIIGNSAYTFGALTNPRNDAELMASTLRSVGFEVTKLVDADQKAMKKAIVEFGRTLRGSDSVGLFYYAGHGVQVDGENYLVPVGAEIKDEREVAVESVAASELLKTMERSAARINIAIFDACRNNPFASSSRSASRGLARIDAAAGTIIAYATAPGDVAADGRGRNSPYTTALASAIAAEGVSIEDVFKRTRRGVLASTGNKQTPWESSSLTGDFYFKPAAAGASAQSSASDDARIAELNAYLKVKSSSDPAEIERFLAEFPDGLFAEEARTRIASLADGSADQATAAPGEGSASALLKKGQRLERENDTAGAAEAYTQAAEQGLTAAIAALGALREREGDFAEAFRLYRQAADKGDAAGLAGLATLLETGQGVAKDEAEAARLYRRASTLGSARALNNLGLMHRDGRGVAKDGSEAFKLILRAAELGSPDAMLNAGRAYETGRGTERNRDEALAWYRRAAEQGNAAAMTALAALVELGTGAEKSIEEAVALYRKAADAGDPAGMASLGYLLEQGKGVPQDPGAAAELYRKAAKAGDARARFHLAGMLREGRGVAPDAAEAARLYGEAAAQGFAAAMLALAEMYDKGEGVAADPDAAAELLLSAYRLGHKGARAALTAEAARWKKSTRESVERRLKLAGALKGKADGTFDEATSSALRSFAKSP